MWRLFLLMIGVAGAAYSEQGAAEERTWRKVVYLGGVPGVRVDRTDFQQTLTLTGAELIVRVEPTTAASAYGAREEAPRLLFSIPLERVSAVTYEGFRHDMPTAQAWIGVWGRWPKATDHLIIIDYRLPDGGEAEVLLRVDKDDYREIVEQLRKLAPSSAEPPATR